VRGVGAHYGVSVVITGNRTRSRDGRFGSVPGLEPDWNPYTRWERLPKWARGLIWALFITVLVWLVLSVAGDQG
jgi:hypothetical protein